MKLLVGLLLLHGSPDFVIGGLFPVLLVLLGFPGGTWHCLSYSPVCA